MIEYLPSFIRNQGKALILGLICLALPGLAQSPVDLPTANAMARATQKVTPDFPPAAKQLNVTGSQEVQVVVNTDGDVEDAKVLKGNAMFTQASLAAVRKWKFQPLVKDGAPSKFSTVIVFNYQR